jgi:hypothetical protein
MAGPRVILLAGAPHGGANITSILLGQHPDIFPTGELKNFPQTQLVDHRTCSCGSRATECDFWTRVWQAYAPLDPGGEETALIRLYEIIADASGRPIVADVAQEASHAARVAGIAGLDLRLIHVVRDGRAVVNAGIRPARRDAALEGFNRWRRIFKLSRRWHRHIREMEAIERQLGPRAIRISYEALCADPAPVLRRLGAFLGIDLAPVADAVKQGRPLRPAPHLLRGGQKFAGQSSIKLRLDDRYKRELTWMERCLVQVAALSDGFAPARPSLPDSAGT